jgi:hypothetical protein
MLTPVILAVIINLLVFGILCWGTTSNYLDRFHSLFNQFPTSVGIGVPAVQRD